MRISRIDRQIRKTEETKEYGMAIVNETERVKHVLENIDEIVTDLDDEFANKTQITNSLDMSFLFSAILLQSLRWVIMPPLKLPNMDDYHPSVDKDSRLNPNGVKHGGIYDGKSSGAIYEQDALKQYRNAHIEKYKMDRDLFEHTSNRPYRTWVEMLTQPVPYDAMISLGDGIIPNIAGLNKIGKDGFYNNLSPSKHHVATLGHDPILGWVFGTANILTSSITFSDFQSYGVVRGHSVRSTGKFDVMDVLSFSDQRIDYTQPIFLPLLFSECIKSIKEDPKRLPAAVVRQRIHMESDKYCKEGLPLPFLSAIDTKRSQELIEKGWNSIEFNALLRGDLQKIGISAIISALINMILEAIYLFCIKDDEDIDIRKVRIKKVLLISNCIVSTSNVLFCAITQSINKLDVGGIAVTLLELFRTPSFIQQIKEEYIASGLASEIMGNDNWMKIAMKEHYSNEE